jgi:hypothetical protein
VDLGPLSAFAEVQERTERLRFHRANPRTPIPYHSGGHHEYGLPQSVLDSDVIIHVPKLKTHKKSGVTLSLKSAIGLCGYKYWLPHYTAGVPPVGDERSSEPTLAERLSERLSRLPIGGGHSLVLRAPRLGTRAPFTEGSWEGNDTIWRTTLDLARILLYADRAGVVRDVPVRACFALVDGLVAGQGDGPFGVEPLDAGLLLAGSDLALVDAVAAGAMGFDWRRIRTIAEAIDRRLLPSTSWALLDERWEGPPPEQPFTPPSTWPSLGDAAPRPAQRTA